MSDDQKGILAIVAGSLFFSAQDVVVKYLSENNAALFQIYVMRAIIGSALLFVILRIWKKPTSFATGYPLLAAVRGCLFFLGFMSFYLAIAAMPLAEATALFFVLPFFVTILSRIIFKMPVGIYRIGSIVVGFIGMLLIIKPAPGNFNWVAVLPVFCAFVYSLSMMIARYTRDKDTAYQQTFHTYIAVVVLGLLATAILPHVFSADHPSASIQFLVRPWSFDNAVILGGASFVAVTGTVGILMLLLGYRIGDPPVVAPFEYAVLISGIITGMIIFDEFPDALSVLGMILIVGSGVFIFIREGIRNRRTLARRDMRRSWSR